MHQAEDRYGPEIAEAGRRWLEIKTMSDEEITAWATQCRCGGDECAAPNTLHYRVIEEKQCK